MADDVSGRVDGLGCLNPQTREPDKGAAVSAAGGSGFRVKGLGILLHSQVLYHSSHSMSRSPFPHRVLDSVIYCSEHGHSEDNLT